MPPTGVTAANRTASSIDLQWDLIEYTGDDGGYHVFYGNQPGGPYRNAGGATTDKLTGSLSVFGLAPPPQHYFFVVRTRTDAHGLQRNTVWSGHSKQVCVPAGAPDDADCDDLPDSQEKDQCVDTALTDWTGEIYQGPGNTRLSNGQRITTAITGTIETRSPHRLILKAPQLQIQNGVIFRVEKGAELLVYSFPDICL